MPIKNDCLILTRTAFPFSALHVGNFSSISTRSVVRRHKWHVSLLSTTTNAVRKVFTLIIAEDKPFRLLYFISMQRSYSKFGIFIVLGLLSASLVNMSTASGSFHYFAFGSNLLAKRIHIQNPTAVRKGFGYLKDFSLDFFHYAARWRGAPATIVEQKGEKVWGAIWEIDNINLADLDRQEGVHNSVYKPLTLPVVLPTGETLECRVYQLVKNPCCLAPDADRPYERQPSKTYMNIIINGAKETGLPEDYIALLKKIKHNGNTGDPQLSIDLEKPIEE